MVNMKIRNGFVSNSSSSSFCIYGTEISESQIKKMLKSEPFKDLGCWKSYCKQCKDDDVKPTFQGLVDDYGISNVLYDLARVIDLDGESVGYSDDMMYIGRSYTTLLDTETGADFKNSVEEKLKPFGFKKFDVFEEAWG
jgi:thiol-disulfide isomerase/thioredoxin